MAEGPASSFALYRLRGRSLVLFFLEVQPSPPKTKAPRDESRGASNWHVYERKQPARRRRYKSELLVNIVLFPVQRRVGLDDDALLGPVFELFHQRRFARLEGLGNLRMDAQGEAAAGDL